MGHDDIFSYVKEHHNILDKMSKDWHQFLQKFLSLFYSRGDTRSKCHQITCWFDPLAASNFVHKSARPWKTSRNRSEIVKSPTGFLHIIQKSEVEQGVYSFGSHVQTLSGFWTKQ